jgi:23S rRNA (cytidine1920-2'-O)/16S rRNA (cytidine1409-2'-O)-methyltransferase
MAVVKKRLDVLLVERGLADTRAKAQGIIMAGEVLVNGELIDKPGAHYRDEVEITVKARPKFVSRGGEKLEGALQDFALDVTGRTAADVGASTGGFTDCLLQSGAAKIYAIDVGYGQLAHKLRTDSRVIPMERTNARYVESLPEPVNLVVIDASFISLRLILPAAKKWLMPESDVVALIKPQFEAGKDDVGKGGVVRRSEIHERVLLEILEFARAEGFTIVGLTRSRITGPAGNIEFLVWLHQGASVIAEIDIATTVQNLLTSN